MNVKAFSSIALIVITAVLSVTHHSSVHAKGSDSKSLDSITMQVRWLHQFQFAGYYAAVDKGFYRERGLDVTIVAGSPTRNPVDEVLAGRAQYGEANSELLHHYLKGEPLVALAAIFQHSPSVLLTRRDSGISSPHQLIGKRVMMVGGTEDIDFLAMFVNEGVSKSDINIIPSSYNIQDLIDGKTDVFNAYLTNEPFYLKEKGIEGHAIKPLNYGVDFYSDILFTTEDEINNHPERVKAFREATLQGWEYAMANKQEIIELILARYGPVKSRKHLEYEAESMENLILPKLIPMGNINIGRFERMANLMVQFGLNEPGYSLDDFIYDPDPAVKWETFVKTTLIIGLLLVITLLVVVALWLFNRRLMKEVEQRHKAEKKLERIAYYDSLTKLPNRRLLYDRLSQDMAHVNRRHGQMLGVAYLDMDGFKEINDNYGHAIGDRFLIALSGALREALRDGDTFARLGGDEFIAILTDLESTDDAVLVIKRLLDAASRKIAIDDRDLQVSASIGITFYSNEDDANPDMLLRQADFAMYKAKELGRNRYHFFDSDNTNINV